MDTTLDKNLLKNNISKCMESLLTDFHDNKNGSVSTGDHNDQDGNSETVNNCNCNCTMLTDTKLQRLFKMKARKFKTLAMELEIWNNLLEQQRNSIDVCSCGVFGADCRSPRLEGVGWVCCEKDYQWMFIKNCLQLVRLLDVITTNCGDGTKIQNRLQHQPCLLYTSPSPRDS